MASPAVPFDMDVEGELEIPPLAIPSAPLMEEVSESSEAAPAPAPTLRPLQMPTTEEGWRRGRKRARLQLEAATDEVERLKPTLGKLLTAVGLNIRESAAGATKQALGNITRTYADIVAPPKPHAPGSFKHLLQLSLGSTIGGALLGSQDQADPESMVNILREGGKDLAAEGTQQMQTARELTESLGGGATVSGAASLASTAGASAPALLAAPLGLPAAAVAAGLQSYGNNVQGFKDRLMELDPKLTDEQAFDKAMLPAAVTGAVTGLLTRGFGGTERFIQNLASQGLRQAGIKGALREVFKSAALEFPEEYIDQLSQGFTEKAYIDPNKSTKQIFDDAALAGLTGFTLGGITTGAISGVAAAGTTAAEKITDVAERSRLRRESDAASRARIKRVIAQRQADEGEVPTTGAVPPVQGQPTQPAAEVQAQAGAALGLGQSAIPKTPITSDVVAQAVESVYPKPPPPPPPPAPKRAVFGGYMMDTIPSYKIPGVRPGIMRDVSAQTAKQLGYEVPEQIPTVEQWIAAGRPSGMEQAAAPDQENLSPVTTLDTAPLQTSFPGQSVQQIAASMPNVPTQVITSYPGGATKFFHALGTQAKTPEDVAALRTMADQHANRVKATMQSGDMSNAMLLVGLQPSEAYEFATGVKLDGTRKWDTFETIYPGYVPAVPDPSYLAAKGLTKAAARPVPGVETGTEMVRRKVGRPLDWKNIATVDAAGYVVLDEEKLISELNAGNLEGGPAANAILAHIIKRSDLHPRGGVILYDMTPEQAGALFSKTGTPFQGRFTTMRGSNVGTVSLVMKTSEGQPINQAQFMITLIHELIHNNVTSKFRQASAEIQQQGQDLYNFVVEISKGTIWETHNATENIDEFFAEALSNPSFQKFLAGVNYGATGKAKVTGKQNSAFGAFLELVKAILKLPDFIRSLAGQEVRVITALEQAVSTAAELQEIQRYSASQLAGEAFSPAQTQVAGGTAEVGRLAGDIYTAREQAGTELETLAYERRQYRMARSEMRRLTDMATAGFIQQGLDPEEFNFPDPTAGVGVEDGLITVDDTFVNALNVANVQHNPANVQAMQAELFFEGSARRYNNLMDQVATLQQAASYYTALKVDEEEIAKVNAEQAKLLEQADKLGSVEHEGRLVSDRAGEIQAAESTRQERMAKVAALSLEPVNDFFGREVGAYRTFQQRLQDGLNMAEQVMASTTDPEAMKTALENVQRWIQIPSNIQEAIHSGRSLTKEQRASIMASLAAVLEDFDFSHARMAQMLESRVPEINKQIRALLLKIADSKVEKNMGEVLIADVLDTLGGEMGATGNLKSMAETQALKQRVAAINSFAMALGQNVQSNQELFNWLTNPSTPKPIIPANMQLGTDPVTLQMIVNEVSRNPDFNSALLTLITAADKKIAEMPITGLEQIQAELKKNDPTADQQAEVLAQGMIRRARNHSRLAGRTMRDGLKQLDKLEIERRSLQEGLAMFQQLAASPAFQATRNAVESSPYGLVEPMVAQNHTETTFKPFGAAGIPSHKGLVLGAADDYNFKSEWFKKVAEWHRTAQEYLDAYDTAAALHHADPTANPSPVSLGFDLPKVRGLRDATQRFVPGSFLELSLLSEAKRWKIPWLVRKFNKSAIFRQHDFVSKMVGGIAGTDLRARLGDFVQHFLIGQSIRDQFRDLPGKMNAALQSHPDLQMNLANYREHFNELAHWGRMFGSPLKSGFVLPKSGRVVTPEDMAFLKRERAYQEQLRRRVTESNITQGVRVKTQTRELVRPGAYVGDEGMPRFPNRQADSFIADVTKAYGDPAGLFSSTSNLGPTSAEPIVQFWNRNTKMLVQHILDIRRTDRDMRIDPGMQSAQTALYNQWLLNGVPAINSLDDLVNLLVSVHPPTPGLNTREVVINALNGELRQYRDAAQRIVTERAEREQSRQSRPDIAFSAQNEFTRPAAKLELPSSLYDYGAITPADHLTMSSRANHERVVAYATAVQRAIGDLSSRLQRYRNGEINEQQAAESYGGDINEMKDVLGILRQVDSDFKNAYAAGSFTNAPRGPITDTLGLLTSAILALPTVGLRNMTQGQFAVYAMSRAMGLAGHRLSAWQTLKQMPKTVVRFALHIADGLARRTNKGLALLTGQNRHILESAIQSFGNLITGTDFRASAQRISDLGLDNREDFLRRLGRIWQETREFVDLEDQQKAWTIQGQRVGKTAAVPFRVIRALFDKVGVQQYDFAINSTALVYAEQIKQRLKQLAIDYGQARTGLGDFDPTNPAWQLKPDEWASFKTRGENEDSLAAFRLLLEGSAAAEGFQLERSLWNYFQEVQQNPQAKIMTDRQFDALTQKLISEFNSSTPANRPSASAASPILRNLLLLQGYPSDLLLKIFNTSIGSVRDRGALANALVKTPALAMLAVMSVLIGMFTSSLTGAWEKYLRGRQPSLATPLDLDFYTNVRRFAEGVLALGSAQFSYIGDLILGMKGEVRGNRGFDPTGRILAVSLLQRFLNAARGTWNTIKGAGDAGDALVPFSDVGRSMVPFWLEAERAIGAAQNPIKQAERVLRGEAQTQGLLEGRGGFTAPSYGPTTVVRRNVGDSVARWYAAQQSNDTATATTELENAKRELAKLEEFHYQKYLASGKDPATARTMAQRDTYNDYQDINPAVSALLGRRPTAAQLELLRQGTTGERGQIVDTGIQAWQAGSMALFGRPGNLTREDVAAGRASGIGRGFAIPGLRMPRYPSFGGFSRQRVSLPTPPPVRAVTSRIRRVSQAPVVRVRGSVRSRRPVIPKPPRIRQPSLPKARRRRTTRRRADRRRRAPGLAPSRRRPYAVA